MHAKILIPIFARIYLAPTQFKLCIFSSYNPNKEALLQAIRININSKIAYVFGIGSGLIQKEILKNKNLKKLYFLIMNYDNVCNFILHVLTTKNG